MTNRYVVSGRIELLKPKPGWIELKDLTAFLEGLGYEYGTKAAKNMRTDLRRQLIQIHATYF